MLDISSQGKSKQKKASLSKKFKTILINSPLSKRNCNEKLELEWILIKYYISKSIYVVKAVIGGKLKCLCYKRKKANK